MHIARILLQIQLRSYSPVLDKSQWKTRHSSHLKPTTKSANAIDGICGESAGDNFISQNKGMQWLQIEFPEVVHGITRVEVAKSSTANYPFEQVELRIGNVDESHKGDVHLSENSLVGYFGEARAEQMAVFAMAEGDLPSGKFLTLQQFSGRMMVAEVFLFVKFDTK